MLKGFFCTVGKAIGRFFCAIGRAIMNYFSSVKKSFKLKNFMNYFVIIAVAIICIILAKSNALKRADIVLLEQICYSVIAAVSLSLVVGFLGELSLGHAGFMCIGAYIGAYFQTNVFGGLTLASPLLSIILAMLIGGLVAAIFGFIIGLPALRLKGDYLAIVTLAFGEIVKVIFQNSPAFGGAIGMDTYRYNRMELFVIGFVMVFITVVVVQNLIRSKHGRAIMAIRDNEIAARAMGVNVTFYKIAVFVLAAFFAGIAGVLLANSNTHIKSATFDYNYSINILVMVVLGGMGSINGSMIAAVVITFLNNQLATMLTGNLAALKNLIYALILIVIVIYRNAPMFKNIREKLTLKKLWKTIKVKVIKKLYEKHVEEDPGREEDHDVDWTVVPTKIDMDEIALGKHVREEKGEYVDDETTLFDEGRDR